MSSIDADSGDMVLSGIRTRRTFAMRFLMLLALLTSSAAFGQISGVRRQPLETANFPCKDLHTTMIRTTLDARSVIAPHRHPGLEVAYVAAGQVEVIIGNAPAQIVAAGGSFQIPPDLRHQVTNTGATAAVIVSTYIVNPAQPLASAAP